jgi:hypothetical protein
LRDHPCADTDSIIGGRTVAYAARLTVADDSGHHQKIATRQEKDRRV